MAGTTRPSRKMYMWRTHATDEIHRRGERMSCRVCHERTDGINVLCHQCQLDMLNEFISNGRQTSSMVLLSQKYKVNISTVMNILKHYGGI